MTARRSALWWLAALAASVALLFALRSILLPFVAGMAVAYLLDPVADRLQRWGLSRMWATTLITVLFFALLLAAGVLFFPVLYGQVVGFLERLPEYIGRVRDTALPLIAALAERLPLSDDPSEVWRAATGLAQNYAGALGGVVLRVAGGTAAVLNLVMLLLITPVVAFYLLRDWDRLVAWIDCLLPVRHAADIREQARRIDQVLASFVRGQAMLGLALGIIYGAGLSLVGLEFGLVIGLSAGLLSFIPYVGMALGVVVALVVALLQFGLALTPLALVVGVFAIGQALETAVLQPRLLGGSVGLHPVWVIFGVLAGGALFGFVGVLLAVPTAAAIGVLVRFAVDRYRLSGLYLGSDGGGGPSDG